MWAGVRLLARLRPVSGNEPSVAHDGTPSERLQRFLDRQFAEIEVRDVLDAGCGFSLPVDLPAGVRIMGLDTSADALAKNRYIDTGIVGDIETYPLPEEGFDVVLCWTVLEHLANPRAALANMARALRPGGLLVVAIPNVWSLKGLVTKLTPHGFHVWAYRRIWGYAEAGTPGFGPYRTHLNRDIAPERLTRLAREDGLERVYASTYALEPRLPRPLKVVWSAVETAGRLVTLGRWSPALSEHVAVFRKHLPAT